MRMTYNHDDNGAWTLRERYRDGIKTFAVLTCMLPGKPLVFDGQEAGMRVFDGAQVRESAPLTHDPQVKIDWADPEGYRAFYTKLLQLFRANPALHHAGFDDFRKIDTTPSEHVYAFVRRDPANPEGNSVVVVLNFSDATANVTLQPTANSGDIGGAYTELFTSEPTTLSAGDTLVLPAWAYRVFVRGPIAVP
jgi:glycosidase